MRLRTEVLSSLTASFENLRMLASALHLTRSELSLQTEGAVLLLISILSWATVCLIIVGFAIKGERDIIKDRIESLRLSQSADVERVVPELALPFGERVIRPMLHTAATALSRLLPTNPEGVAGKLDQAGNPLKLQPAEFRGLKALSIIVFLVCGAGLSLVIAAGPLQKVLVFLCAVIIGYAIPDTLLESAIRERHRAIRKTLPNSLDLLVVSAEAGLGFDGALAKVVERTQGPLSDEFGRVLQDMSLGRSRVDALKSMSVRVGLPELTTFVAAIRQADIFGASVVRVLRVQASSMRQQRNLRARETAAKLPVKLLFPLVFCIFPAIFAVVLGPGLIQIVRALSVVNR